jgi:hypothetical protein
MLGNEYTRITVSERLPAEFVVSIFVTTTGHCE